MLLEDFGQGKFAIHFTDCFVAIFYSPGDDPQNFYDSLTYSVES